ncbi:MAG: hypothetical protein H6613_10205 [Ignavibacteriales bacterium]|nr:hypothetical protein [Ignavibacteriales bacterium]
MFISNFSKNTSLILVPFDTEDFSLKGITLNSLIESTEKYKIENVRGVN